MSEEKSSVERNAKAMARDAPEPDAVVDLPVVAKVAWADSAGDIEAFHVEDPDKVFPEVQSGDLLVRKKDAEKKIRRLKKQLDRVKSE